MKEVVRELVAMVGGNGNGVKSEGYAVSSEGKTAGNGIVGSLRKALTTPRKKTGATLPPPQAVARRAEPGEVIPMEESAFNDF